MRDIIFRGIGIKSREWVYGAYVPAMDEDDCDSIIDEQGEHHIVFSDTVGQYTGLQDKNGKEIWEGDIVMAETNDEDHPMSELPFVIVFSDGAFCIAEDEESPWAPIDTFMDMEVIGNIHDNPDLLK